MMLPVRQIDTRVLVIGDVEIHQDEFGRYNLNSLHHASGMGSDPSKAPKEWARRKSTKSLISELESQGVNSPLEVVHGGDRRGTYAHEILAVEYAGWISPAFRIKVNQAFIDMRMGRVNMPEFFNPSTKAAIEALMRIDAMEARQAEQEHRVVQAQAMALQAMQAQQYMTIREYVMYNDLVRQLPPGRTQQEFGKYLAGHCRDTGWPLRKMPTENPFTEWAYPVHVITERIHPWLARRNGQLRIDIHEDGIWHNDN